MRVLVTGGAGFIGSHIADKLIELGHEVTIVDNESTGFAEYVPKEANYLKGDISDINVVRKAFEYKPEVIYHLAAQASNILSFTKPEMYIEANVIGTLNIVRECLKNKIPRLLNASSMTCYGELKHIPVGEEDPCVPVSYYAITKYAAERFVQATAERPDLDFDFNATSFRMFNVYGPRQSLNNPYQGVIMVFISNILKGEPITIYGDGEQTREFTYISDVVDAWVGCMDNEKTYGNVYNIGYGEDITINRLADVVLSRYGRDRINYPIVYKPARPGDQRRSIADISKITRATDWRPKVNFDSGMNEVAKWVKMY